MVDCWDCNPRGKRSCAQTNMHRIVQSCIKMDTAKNVMLSVTCGRPQKRHFYADCTCEQHRCIKQMFKQTWSAMHKKLSQRSAISQYTSCAWDLQPFYFVTKSSIALQHNTSWRPWALGFVECKKSFVQAYTKCACEDKPLFLNTENNLSWDTRCVQEQMRLSPPYKMTFNPQLIRTGPARLRMLAPKEESH